MSQFLLATILPAVLVLAPAQLAWAKDVSNNTSAPQTVVANKTYTHKFEKKGDVDCFKFKSGGGKYKLEVWDKSGRKLSYYGEIEQWADGSYDFFGDWDKGMSIRYGEYSTFSSAGGAAAKYQVGSITSTSFSPSVNGKTGKASMKMTTSIGSHKKGKEVAIWFEGDYKGKYKFRIVGKNSPKTGSSSTKADSANKGSTAKKTVTKLTKSNSTISIKDVTWTGKAQKPKATVKVGKKTLKKGTDYTVSYSNNKNVGKATVKVTGKGSYTGSIKAHFKVKAKGKVYALTFGAAKGQSPSSDKNVDCMNIVFRNLKIPGYSLSASNVKVRNYNGFNVSQFQSAVSESFKNATSKDLCFIYLNTHGKEIRYDQWYRDWESGETKQLIKYVGVSTGETAQDYYSWLEMLDYISSKAKGKIIFLPEVCYSGNFVNAAKDCKARNRITVLSAASTDSGSNNQWFFGTLGRYTNALSRALGVDYTKSVSLDFKNSIISSKSRLVPDGKKYGNGDGKVTLREIANYVMGDPSVVKTGQLPMFYSSNKNMLIYQK